MFSIQIYTEITRTEKKYSNKPFKMAIYKKIIRKGIQRLISKNINLKYR